MKITVQTSEYDGHEHSPLPWHLVSSAYVVEDPILKIVINFDNDAELICTGSTEDNISFHFNKDQDWCGSFQTEVTITGETAEEIEKLKMNPFRQKEKGQLVVALLPWDDVNDGVMITSWDEERVENDERF